MNMIEEAAWTFLCGVEWMLMELCEELRYYSALVWKRLREDYKGKKYRPYRKLAYACCMFFGDQSDIFEDDLRSLGWDIEEF